MTLPADFGNTYATGAKADLQRLRSEKLTALEKEIVLCEVRIVNMASHKAQLVRDQARFSQQIDEIRRTLGPTDPAPKKLTELSAEEQFSRSSAAQVVKDLGEAARQLRHLESRRAVIEADYQKDMLGASAVYNAAYTVGDTSGKDKLYIGNRQLVTNYTKGNESKESRILNLNRWEWGINLAWVEGGIDAGVVFKIKQGAGQWDKLPDDAQTEMMTYPRMSADEFIALCRRFPGTMLWDSRDNRLTWTACEIIACLNAGYHFQFNQRTSDPNEFKITLQAD